MLLVRVPCDACQGTGFVDVTPAQICWRARSDKLTDEHIRQHAMCPVCKGQPHVERWATLGTVARELGKDLRRWVSLRWLMLKLRVQVVQVPGE